MKEEKELKQDLEIGKQLVEDGNKSVRKGSKECNMTLVNKGSVLIETDRNKIGEAESKLDKIKEKQKEIGQEKNK